jgi:hypothetical protein
LVIIGYKNQFALDEELKKRISHKKNKLKKRTLLVEVSDQNVEFIYKPVDFY